LSIFLASFIFDLLRTGTGIQLVFISLLLLLLLLLLLVDDKIFESVPTVPIRLLLFLLRLIINVSRRLVKLRLVKCGGVR